MELSDAKIHCHPNGLDADSLTWFMGTEDGCDSAHLDGIPERRTGAVHLQGAHLAGFSIPLQQCLSYHLPRTTITIRTASSSFFDPRNSGVVPPLVSDLLEPSCERKPQIHEDKDSVWP